METQENRLVTKAVRRALSACAAVVVASITLLPWFHFVAGGEAAHACYESPAVTDACSSSAPTEGGTALAAETACPAEPCWICQVLALLFHEHTELAGATAAMLPHAPDLHACRTPPVPVTSFTVYPACRSHAPPAEV